MVRDVEEPDYIDKFVRRLKKRNIHLTKYKFLLSRLQKKGHKST